MKLKILLILTISLSALSSRAQSVQQTTSDVGERNALANDLNNWVKEEGMRNFTGGEVPSFNVKGETLGNRYLFDKWVPGSVKNLRDSVLTGPSWLFNYDKVTQSLLLFQDKKRVIEVYPDQIKSFTLMGPDKEYHFEHINMINEQDFFQAVVQNKKYSLYQVVRTRFIKADFSSNGISESGNNYDEYRDQPVYYIMYPGGKSFAKVELRRKSIKDALPKEKSRIDAFFFANPPEKVDGNFLIALINDLNK